MAAVGTVGLRLTPKGEVEVTGKVALPSQFTVFDEKKVERKMLSIGIDIPIIGVAVAGQRIGIFATIKGGLTVSAGFGPGQLRDVALEVAYNPSRPDDTTVKGTGSFVVPGARGPAAAGGRRDRRGHPGGQRHRRACPSTARSGWPGRRPQRPS